MKISRKRRKKLWVDASKIRSRRAKLKHRRVDYGLFEE
jgi:hypothetical protein